jgi:hypothetical protein
MMLTAGCQLHGRDAPAAAKRFLLYIMPLCTIEKFQNMTPNSTVSHGLTPNSSTFQELTPGTRIASKLGTLLIFSSSSTSFHRLASFFFLLRFWCQGHGDYHPSQGQQCGGGSSGGQGPAARWCSGRLRRGHPHVRSAVSSAATGAAPSYGRSSRGRDLGWTGFGSATTEARVSLLRPPPSCCRLSPRRLPAPLPLTAQARAGGTSGDGVWQCGGRSLGCLRRPPSSCCRPAPLLFTTGTRRAGRYWRKKKGILVHSPGHEEGK